jgi:hypothetical protein
MVLTRPDHNLQASNKYKTGSHMNTAKLVTKDYTVEFYFDMLAHSATSKRDTWHICTVGTNCIQLYIPNIKSTYRVSPLVHYSVSLYSPSLCTPVL